jgi:hypothetical protein
MPRHSASRIRATSGARSANFGFTYNASRCESPTGSPQADGVILLTAFNKTRRSEVAEVQRAFIAQKDCEASHSHAESIYNREISDE